MAESSSDKLRKMIKEQRSIIKDLKKQLARISKRSHLHEDLEEKIKEYDEQTCSQTHENAFYGESCPECSATLPPAIAIGANRALQRCNDCSYRKTIKTSV